MKQQKNNKSKAGSATAAVAEKKKKPVSEFSAIINANRKLILSIILFLTLIVYLPALKSDFVTNWDDKENVIDNADIKHFSFQNIKSVFTSFYAGMYAPLTMVTYSFNYFISGLNPFSYHLTNLLLHLINVFLVYHLFRIFSGRTEVGVLCSLLFAIHPMNVEGVAWISTRSNVLHSLFYFASLIFYIRFLKEGFPLKLLVFSFLLFVLALFSKSAAITLPLAMFLIDYFLKRKFTVKSISEKIPFIALSLVFAIITLYARETARHITILDAKYPLAERLLFVIYSMNFYVLKLFAPVNLSGFYAYPKSGFLEWYYYASPLLLILLVFSIYIFKTIRRELIFALLFYLATIFPVLKIIPVGLQITADRYGYIPYLGLYFVLARIYCLIVDNYPKKIPIANLMVLVFAIFFAATSFQRTKVWKDGVVFFTDAIKKDPALEYAYYNRAVILAERNQPSEALKDYYSAIKLKPSYLEAYVNAGMLLEKSGDYNSAISGYSKFLKLRPDNALMYFTRGNSFYAIEQDSLAILDFTRAIQLKHGYEEALFNRGSARYNIADDIGAIQDFEQVIRLNPKSYKAYYLKGLCELNLNRKEEACRDFRYAADNGDAEAMAAFTQQCR